MWYLSHDLNLVASFIAYFLYYFFVKLTVINVKHAFVFDDTS